MFNSLEEFADYVWSFYSPNSELYPIKCLTIEDVFHFSWSALTCQSCKESINKEDWILEVIKHEVGR